eukprot:15354786-Ditylum_brightwellii.AAC.1
MADELILLFSAAEKDPNKVFYFVTKKALCEEAEEWINDLPETLVTRFSVDDMDSVTTDTHPTRSYQVIPSENTDDAVSAYNLILVGNIFTNGYVSGAEPNVIEIVEEDVLEKCWKALSRSVYLNTATDTTHYSTVSGITENNYPAKSTATAHKEKEWRALVECTAALEKVAEDLAATEKANQIEFECKNAEWKQNQKQTITELQEKNETFTRTMITENLDKLLQESEEAKEKNKEMEEWQIAFDT